MQISSSRFPMQTPQVALAPAPQQQAEAAPEETFTFSQQQKTGHYAPGKIMMRAAGGAITGLLANKFSDGSTWGVAKLGATVNGVIGAGFGGIAGAAVGGAAGGPGGAAIAGLTGAAVVGIPAAVTGGVKGALIGVVGNMLGGGPVAFAGSGALLGVLGL